MFVVHATWRVVVVAILAACGQLAKDSQGPGSLPRSIDVVATEFAFSAPDSVAAGVVRMTFHNRGRDYHHVQVVRAETPLSIAAVLDSLPDSGALPAWLIPVGGVEGADSLARPVTVELSLQAGRHLLICRIITADKKLHYHLGMIRELAVVDDGRRSERDDLSADTTVTLVDFAFRSPDSLAAGVHRFLVRNEGRQEHHLALARIAPGKSLRDVAAVEPGPTDVFHVLGGTAGLARGEENLFEVDLPAGRYVFLCFVPDQASRKDHYQLGMLRELVVR